MQTQPPHCLLISLATTNPVQGAGIQRPSAYYKHPSLLPMSLARLKSINLWARTIHRLMAVNAVSPARPTVHFPRTSYVVMRPSVATANRE